MTDRPILQTAADVRAALAGRKTQARAVLKPQPGGIEQRPLGFVGSPARFVFTEVHPGGANWTHYAKIPYTPGDRLWVREAWRVEHRFNTHSPIPHDSAVQYPADDPLSVWDSRLRPSTQLPRWSSRLTYIVTDVRVQRLQEISEADAIAEGIVPVTRRFPPLQGCLNQLRERTMYEWSGGWSVRAADAYAALWNSLHGPGAWDANPWVAAITFDVVARNIDAT